MAIYHCEINTGSRSGGHSAGAKADYIQREGKYKPAEKELLYKESGNMPAWAKDDPSEYWKSADIYERANGRLFKEVEFALPRELTLEQNRDLAREFARHLTNKEALPFTLAIHAGKGTNPHCHLLISERKNDGIDRSPDRWFKRYDRKEPHLKGGAEKTESLKPRQWFDDTVRQWAEFANRHLERAGHEVRIDHRSLKEQGIERLPGIHLGPNVIEMEKRGIETDRGSNVLEVEQANAEIINLAAYRESLQKENSQQGVEHEPELKPAKIGFIEIVKGYISHIREFFGKEKDDEQRRGSGEKGTESLQPERGDRTAAPESGRGIERSAADSGEIGRGDRTPGKEHERVIGRITPRDNEPDRNAQEKFRGTGKEDRLMERQTRAAGGKMVPDHERSAGNIQERPQSHSRMALEILGGSDLRGTAHYDSALSRIKFLAAPFIGNQETAKVRSTDGRTVDSNGRNPESAIQKAHAMVGDRTYRAVMRQLQAMNCARYDVGIRHAATGKMMNRTWTGRETQDAVSWLKHMNARGNDIYIRPAQGIPHGLVLMDDIDRSTVEQMREDGHAPALVVETSPKNYQAWVRVGDSVPDQHRKEIARHFVKEYGADPGSADARHYGRLGGFTNQKEKYMDEYGRRPWVLVRDSNGRPAMEGKALIRIANEKIEERSRQSRALERQKPRSLRERSLRNPGDFFKSEMKGLTKRFKDKSKCDWVAAIKMAKAGYTHAEISKAMQENSPDLDNRKGRYADSYVKRTVDKVMALPDVVKAQERQLEQGRDRGGDFGMSR